MAKRNLFMVKVARAFRTMFGGPATQEPKSSSRQRPSRKLPPILSRNDTRRLTLAFPVSRDRAGYYFCHDISGNVWRAMSVSIEHGWDAVPFEDRPTLVQIRDLRAHLTQAPAPQVEFEEEEPVAVVAEEDPEHEVDTNLEEYDGPLQEPDPEYAFPIRLEGVARPPTHGTPLAELDLANHALLSSAEPQSPFTLDRAYSIPEISALGGRIIRFESTPDGSIYAILSDSTPVMISRDASHVPTPARPPNTRRWLYLPEPKDPAHSIINAAQIEEVIYAGLHSFMDRDECKPLFAHLSEIQKGEYLEKAQKWVKHLVRKVLAKDRDLVHSITPEYDFETKEVLSLYASSMSISSTGYQTNASLDFYELSDEYLNKHPWLKDLGVYTQATSRPMHMSLLPGCQQRCDWLVFAFVDRTGDRTASNETPELDQFLFPEYLFHPDSIVIRDIIASFVGFLMDPTITRNWSEYNISTFGPESMVKMREVMMAYWMKESTELPGYEQFYLSDHKGNPYVLVPLKTHAYNLLEGRAMRHCVANYEPTISRRFYSIREAKWEGNKLIAVRSRITFDVSCNISYDENSYEEFMRNAQNTPDIVVPPVRARWAIGSIKGVRNKNNPEWSALVHLAGHLIGVPELGKYYEPDTE